MTDRRGFQNLLSDRCRYKTASRLYTALQSFEMAQPSEAVSFGKNQALALTAIVLS